MLLRRECPAAILTVCLCLIGGCSGALDELDTPALAVGRHYYEEFKSLCEQGRFVEAAIEYEYGLNKYGYAMEHQPRGSRQGPVNIPTEPILEPLSRPENIDKLVEVEEWGSGLPFLGPKVHDLLAKMLDKPASMERNSLIHYYTTNAARLKWDAKAGAFTVNVNIPPGRKLPEGFEPVKDSGLSKDGYPLRILCLKDRAEMVYVPKTQAVIQKGILKGSFVMAGPLYIDKYEVSNDQYAKFCGATNHAIPQYVRHWLGKGREPQERVLTGFDDPQQPVTCVRLEDVIAYTQWASKTLPTMDEWYIAAMGNAKGPFPWGQKPVTTQPSELDKFAILGKGDPIKGGRPAKVGGRPAGASWCGAEDMLGNVAEWIAYREGEHLRSMGLDYFHDWPDRLGYDSSPEGDFPGFPAQTLWIGLRCVLLLEK